MRCRPSAVYRIEERYGAYPAYCFDSSVIMWGTAFENAMQEAGSKAKTDQAAAAAQGRVLRQWVPVGAAGYADPSRR